MNTKDLIINYIRKLIRFESLFLKNFSKRTKQLFFCDLLSVPIFQIQYFDEYKDEFKVQVPAVQVMTLSLIFSGY